MNKTSMNAAFDAARELAKSCPAGAWVAVHSFSEAWYGDGWTPPVKPRQGGSFGEWEFRHGADKAWKWSPGLKRERYMARDEDGNWGIEP